MKILAAQRLRAASDTVPLSVVSTKVEGIVKNYFPRSLIEVEIEKGSSNFFLNIFFTLGSNKGDYRNGRYQLDPLYTNLLFKVATSDGEIQTESPEFSLYKSVGVAYLKNGKEVIEVTSKGFRAKNLTEFYKELDSLFSKQKALAKRRVDNISEFVGKDMSSFIK